MRYLFLLASALAFHACRPPALVQVTYAPSDEIFPNPERGLYRQLNIDPSKEQLLDTQALAAVRRGGNSLVLFYCYLGSCRNGKLSAAALQSLETNMQRLREAGLKCILRFAYSSGIGEADAPLPVVLLHLDQLRPLLSDNVDVIALMQAGFIGVWGEFHSSVNNLTEPVKMGQIIDKLLATLPGSRMVQLRTPYYKTAYLHSSSPLTAGNAFNGSNAARLGHHNDCFMASADDYGTYRDTAREKAYLHQEGIFVPMGGETCPPQGIAPADCEKALHEMRYLRWSFLHEDYFREVLARWDSAGCMNDIRRGLGYRFQLQSGQFTGMVRPGGAMEISVKLVNTGYGALYNLRPVELVLHHPGIGRFYRVRLHDDPRWWQPDTPCELQATVGIPADMPEGTYRLWLSLPAPEAAIYGNPAYSVRFANQGVWDPQTGYNDLHASIRVSRSAASKTYKGNLFFSEL